MFGWFKDPLKKKDDSKEKDEEEYYDNVEEFLEAELDITKEDFELLKVVLKNPKAFALKTLNMSNEAYVDFIQWHYSNLTERLRMCFRKTTAVTHLFALVSAYKEKEYLEGEESIKNDNWKFKSPKEHLEEAIAILQYCLKNEKYGEMNIVKAVTRLFYCLFTVTFTQISPQVSARNKMKEINVNAILVETETLPPIIDESVPKQIE